jgi:DNA-binding CsgD family transcriptional regulator
MKRNKNSTDPSDYDIDPLGLDYDDERSNGWLDSTNNRRNHLNQLQESDIWVCYRTYKTGRSEYDSTLKGIGRLSFEGVSLDTEGMASGIRDSIEELGGKSDPHEIEPEVAEELLESAEELAEEIASEWQRGCEEVLMEAACNGHVNVSGKYCWTEVTEPYIHDIDHALHKTEFDLRGTRAPAILQEVLAESVASRRESWRDPHAEYMGYAQFGLEPWELRSLELMQNGRIPKQTAKTLALHEHGKKNREIANELDVDPSTVTRHLNRAERIVKESQWTVEKVDL